MNGCRRLVIRPFVFSSAFRHYSSKQFQPQWPEQQTGDGPNQMVNMVHNESTALEMKFNKPDRKSGLTFNKVYSPLNLLRSRGFPASQHVLTPLQVGPGAREALQNDVFRQLDIDPLRETNNTTLLKTYITLMGKIRPRSQTKLSWRSQRKVAKAIRRAKQKGVMSILVKKDFLSH